MADLGALYFVNPDALLRMVGPAWVLSNPLLRTHVGLDAAAAQALVVAGAGWGRTACMPTIPAWPKRMGGHRWAAPPCSAC